MKIYTARASQKKLKYYEEQIHFTLDGSKEYNWRQIQAEIKSSSDLVSMPSSLLFITDKTKFNDLDKYSWLKCEFRIPVLANKFIESIAMNINFDYQTYHIDIIDKTNKENRNSNFSGFYIKEYFNCINKEVSTPIKTSEIERYDYRNAIFKDEIEYPPLFKIQGISTPFMHFVNEKYKIKFEEEKILGVDFKDVSTVK